VSGPVRARQVGRRHAIAAVVGTLLVGATAVPWLWPSAVCQRTETIEVSSSTEKAGIVGELAHRYNSAGRVVDGLCAKIAMTPRSSGTMKNEIAAGRADPEVWLPTSSMWLQLLEHEGHGNLVTHDLAPRSIATSTLVIAMPQAVADALAAAGRPLHTWADVLALAQQGWSAYGKPEWGDFILGRDNAETSTSGLSATVATYFAARGDITKELLDDPEVVGFVHGIESSVSRYGDEAVRFMEEIYAADQTQDAGTYRPYVDALVVQEQMAYLYNRGAPGGDPTQLTAGRLPRHPLRVVHPQDGTIRLDHPFVVLASASPEQRAVAEDFYEFLVSDEQQRRFADLGFRPRNDAARPTEQLVQALGVPASQQLRFVEIPGRELLAEMLNRWDNVRRKARVLLLLDVSGSMNDVVDDPNRVEDPTKLQLAIPAVQQCALDLLDDDDEVGLWTFSSNPPHTESMPVSRLGDVRGELEARIQGLTASGNTALYQATDAASEMMARTADPERINAIVLLSDGQNTEPYPGDAQALLGKLNPQGRDTSVRIFTVPYGHAENADIPTLAEIARLTRAAQYDASNPLDLCGAFVQVFRNFG
jgi:Ca-activated chloride channel family protein